MDEDKKIYESGQGNVEYNTENLEPISNGEIVEASSQEKIEETEVIDLKTHHMDEEGNLTVVDDGHTDARYYEEDRHDDHVNVADRDFPSAHDYNTHDLGGKPYTDVTRDGEAYGNFQPSDFDTRENVVLDPDQTRVENVEEIDPTVE